MHGIYQIRNIIDSKLYIGSAIDITKRWILHKCLLNSNRHHSKHLQHAWNLYGKDNFKFEVIEEIMGVSKLISREKFWINKSRSFIDDFGYNMVAVPRSLLGFKHSDDSKLKISVGHLGKKRKPFTQEHRLKISIANKGKIRSEECKNKISVSCKGRSSGMRGKSHSEETKLKISINKKGQRPWLGKHHTEETKKKISKSKLENFVK